MEETDFIYLDGIDYEIMYWMLYQSEVYDKLGRCDMRRSTEPLQLVII